MGHLMRTQVRTVRKCPVAKLAAKRPFSSVQALVFAQVGALVERLATGLTLEGLGARVNALMYLEVNQTGEALSAVLTRVRSFRKVRAFVLMQRVKGRHHYIAEIAFKSRTVFLGWHS